MSHRIIPLTSNRISALSNECFGVTPTEQQLKAISEEINRFIRSYGDDEVPVSEVCDIIGEVVLDF
mgnify:FL=1